MDQYRKIEFRSTLFDGYNVWIDVSKYNDMNNLVNDAKMHLVNFLKTFNLKSLKDHALNSNFTLEMYTDCSDIVKRTTSKDVIYVYESSNMI